MNKKFSKWRQKTARTLKKWRKRYFPTHRERVLRYHLWLGKRGEQATAADLQARGYELLCSNYRYKKSELDLIMRYHGILCFVEVKTRRWKPGVVPADAIDLRKEENVYKGGMGYLRQIGFPHVTCRFDIVEVFMMGRRPVKIRHLPGELLRHKEEK